MASFQAPGGAPGVGTDASTAPMVALFERDDAIAVPLLSQVRLAGYDVRAARTTVDFFDLLTKHAVTLVLVDLGNAAASRREFWVALDARRRSRPLHVLTFRVKAAAHELEPDAESTAQALADVEVSGPYEFARIVEGVRQRVPLHGGFPGAGMPGVGQQFGAPPSYAPGYGGASQLPNGGPYSQPGFGGPSMAAPYSVPGWEASPFAQPAQANPFDSGASRPGNSSPFAQPYSSNPFGAETSGAGWQSSAPGVGPFGARSAPGAPHLGNSGPNGPSSVAFGGHGAPARPGSPFGAGASSVRGGDPFAAFGASSGARAGSSQPGAFGASQPSSAASKPAAKPSIADAWAPPEADDPAADQDTGVVPGMAFQPIRATNDFAALADAARAASASLREKGGVAVGQPLDPKDEQALSSVLIEGALLSPHTLEVLRGVQQMLGTVDMKLNIGELAMLFKFLSADQYLAALLVSRGLVSPQQIASLGRLKQELSVAGLDYDLETLLTKYNVLSPDQLTQVRAEIGKR